MKNKKAIWVLENINKSDDFYNELTIIMLAASICSWKKHNSTFNELHCDSITFKKLDELGLLSLWDNVNTSIVEEHTIINRHVFWANSKNRVLLKQTSCVSLVDTDFISYAPISNIGYDYPIVCSHDEDGVMWYPVLDDWYINKINILPKWLMPIPDLTAINVSYLSFNNLYLQKEYAYYSVKAMEELSILDAPCCNVHQVWAEQKLLKQFIIHKQVKYKPLISNMFSCKTGEYFNNLINQDGEWTFAESIKKYRHIGFDKPTLRRPGANLKFLYEMCEKFINTEVLKQNITKKLTEVKVDNFN